MGVCWLGRFGWAGGSVGGPGWFLGGTGGRENPLKTIQAVRCYGGMSYKIGCPRGILSAAYGDLAGQIVECCRPIASE